MKIALCLSGQIRSFKIAFEYMNKNLLSCNDVDVYFHTWSKNWDDDVLSLYKPKNFIIEDQSCFRLKKQDYRIAGNNHPAFNTFMMYRSNMMVNTIRKSFDIKYDWIIRTRFDFALNTKIDFSLLNSEKMYYCNTRSNSNYTEVNDQVVISKNEGMDMITSIYHNIDRYHDEGCIVNGENLLQWHLFKNNSLNANVVEYIDLNPPFNDGNYNYGKHSLVRTDMHLWG